MSTFDLVTTMSKKHGKRVLDKAPFGNMSILEKRGI